MRLSSRAAAWTAAVLLALHALASWVARAPGILTAEDDSKYLLLGRALRHLSYREPWRNNHPIHGQYPPGYPAVLAIAGWFTGDRFDLLIALNILFSCAALFLTWHIVRRRWSDAVALCVLVVLALNHYLVDRAGQLVSEPLFMLLMVATAALLADDDPSPRQFALAGALAIFAALTRSAGTPIVVAVVVLWLLQRRWRPALILAVVGLVTVGAWLAWTLFAVRHGAESYVPEVEAALRVPASAGPVTPLDQLGVHIAEYGSTIFPLLLAIPTIPGTIMDNIIGAGLVAIGLVAGLLALWRRWRAAALILLGVLGLLIVWPWIATRFAEPLVPLLAAAVLIGLGSLARAIRPSWELPVMAAFTLLLLASSLFQTADLVAARAPCQRGSWPPAPSCETVDQASFFAATRYINQHLPADAVFIAAKAQPLYYYTGRTSLPTRGENIKDGVKFVNDSRRAGAGWILLGSLHASERAQLRRDLVPACTMLSVDTTFPPRTVLFRIREAPVPSDSTACRALEDYRRASMNRDFTRE